MSNPAGTYRPTQTGPAALRRGPILLASLAAILVGTLGALFWARQRSGPPATDEPEAPSAATRPPNEPAPGPAIPPKLIRGGPAKSLVQVDPRAPDYDFERVYRVLDGDVQGIHTAEPRDPVWSPAMDKKVTGNLGRDLETSGLQAKINSVDCRTSTCKLVIEAKTEKELDVAVDLVQDLRVGDYVSFGGAAEGLPHGFVLYMGFSKEWRSLATHDRAYSGFRQRQLAIMRKLKAESGSFDYVIPSE